jgi:hypothetical protein
MKFKTGNGWKACYDEEKDFYAAEYGGIMAYNLYEISKQQYDRLSEDMSESDVYEIVSEGRHLYMSVDDRCGPPYDVAFDDDYKSLCPWARIMSSGHKWSDELTDAAVEVFESEKNNREQRRKKREKRNSKQAKEKNR